MGDLIVKLRNGYYDTRDKKYHNEDGFKWIEINDVETIKTDRDTITYFYNKDGEMIRDLITHFIESIYKKMDKSTFKKERM